MSTFIFYIGPINHAGALNLRHVVTEAVSEGAKEITVCVSSYGGDVCAGMGLYNFLLMQPIQINTHAIGPCESIAATILLSGVKRTASPASSVSLHAASYSDGPRIGEISDHSRLISIPFEQLEKWNSELTEKYFSSTDAKQILPKSALDMGIFTAIENIKIDSTDTVLNVNITISP